MNPRDRLPSTAGAAASPGRNDTNMQNTMTTSHRRRFTKAARGLTLIQLMFILLIAGIVGTLVVRFIIDKRCESDPSTSLCQDRKPAK